MPRRKRTYRPTHVTNLRDARKERVTIAQYQAALREIGIVYAHHKQSRIQKEPWELPTRAERRRARRKKNRELGKTNRQPQAVQPDIRMLDLPGGLKRIDLAHYITTQFWRHVVRPRVIKRDGGKCRVCSTGNNLQVHHRSYGMDVMRGENDDKLITLCRDCHVEVEFTEYHGKKDPQNKRRPSSCKEPRLNQMLEARSR